MYVTPYEQSIFAREYKYLCPGEMGFIGLLVDFKSEFNPVIVDRGIFRPSIQVSNQGLQSKGRTADKSSFL